MPDATLASRSLAPSPRRARGWGRLPRLALALALGLAALAAVTRVAGAQQRDTTRAPRRDTTRTVPRDTSRVAPRTPADTTAAAQDTTRRRQRGRPRRAATTAAVPDSVARPPISPRRAFLYSLVVPGQGQTSLHRPKAAALFATIEIGSVAMIAKSRNDLRIARARVRDSVVVDSTLTATGYTYTKKPDRLVARIKARRLHVEDWMATLLFNHLFAGADAFVAAQLWDLPAQVSFQPMPRGAAVTVSVPW
ncbi:MAG TPA: hypothetical protein VNS52_09410 [Gemmatimonadaceae bacterium]|nr:hypothetical protein [Gemmatimonadaceae bacterium]